MNKFLVAMGICIVLVVVALAAGPHTSAKQAAPKWDLQTVEFMEGSPSDLSKIGSPSLTERKEYMDSMKRISDELEKQEKESLAEQKKLLDEGYEPFAVVKNPVSTGVPDSDVSLMETTVYFKKQIR